MRVLLLLLLLFPALAAGQAFPAKAIRIMVPWAPGGSTDVLARLIGIKMSENWGQPAVVENKPGASGNIGSELVARSAADGHTILVGSVSTHAMNPFLVSSMTFKGVDDFATVAMAAYVTNVLVTHPTVPAKSVRELIALLKAQPGKIAYASAGNGSPNHVAAELFRRLAGVDMLHVPYKGGGPALNAVMGGETQIHYPAGSVGIPQVKSGRVRGIAFTGAKRLTSLPDLPTIGETLPGFVADAGWHALFAPPKTPPAILNRLHQSMLKAMRVPQVHEYFASNGYDPKVDPPAVWAKGYREELKRLAEIAKAAKLEPQ